MAAPSQAEAAGLLEREDELEALAGALSAAAGGEGAVLVVEGPAGIGKTRLVEEARHRAAEAGMEVLAARGSDLEREYRWGVVRQLFEPVLTGSAPERRAALLSGAAALAEGLLSAGGAGEEGAFLHGLYWLSANLAARAPVLLALDDAHWADLPSMRFAAYLARRVEGLPLALLVAARPGEAVAARDLLERLGAFERSTVVRPAALSTSGVAGVLAARLGEAPDARLLAASQEATQGNPYLLAELARALRDRGLAGGPAAGEAVSGLGPRSVARAVARRTRALAPGAEAVAQAVSVLGSDADVRRCAALAGLDPAVAASAADALVAAEVLAPGRPLDFIHPLARAAVHDDLPSGRRTALHAAAARLLAAEGADDDHVAAHLLATEPTGDPRTVTVLRRAAGAAAAQGAPAVAVTYLERALAEPPAAADLATVLHELGHAAHVEGRMGVAKSHLRRAWALSRSAEHRARIGLDLARADSGADWRAAGRTCLEALELPGLVDGRLSRRLEGELITLALNEFELMGPVRDRLRRRLAELASGALRDPLLLGALGLTLACNRAPAAVGADAVRRLTDVALVEDNSLLPGCVGNALLFAGELEDAAAYYAAVSEDSRRRGWRFGAAWGIGFRARVSLELGEVRRAEEEGRLALEWLEDALAEAGGTPRGYLTAHLVMAVLERGLLDDAEDLLASCDPPDGPAVSYWSVLHRLGRSRLRLAQGRPAAALEDAEAAGPAAMSAANPATAPWRSAAADALVALGRPEEAAGLAAEEVVLARRFAVPHAVCRALRAAARAERDHRRAAALLEEAAAVVAGTGARLELARAQVERGMRLRRAGERRAAVAELRCGLDLAHRSGAAVLEATAREELVAAGARPRRAALRGADALTVAERRVADLAAEGRTNPEIAQALFVTARTVEGHLTHAYGKLGITSRRELRTALMPGDAAFSRR